MAIDLTDLIPFLKAEVGTPGEDVFPEADNNTWLVYLQNGFWRARRSGLLSGYTELDGEVSPITGDTDLDRDQQDIIILMAAITVIRNQMKSVGSSFRAKAGPVEFETQNSATIQREILNDLKSQLNIVMQRLSDLGVVTDVYIDAVAARYESLDFGDTWWTG